MNVQEVRQLDAYLKKLFGNNELRVVPKADGSAVVFVGDDDLGELEIQLGEDPAIQPVPALNAYLRGRFGNDNIRVVTRPKKMDSLEAYIGEEFLGVLFVENERGRRSYIFELPILDVDLAD